MSTILWSICDRMRERSVRKDEAIDLWKLELTINDFCIYDL